MVHRILSPHVPDSGIVGLPDLFVIEVIHDDRMSGLRPAVGRPVVGEGTPQLLRQVLCLPLQVDEVGAVLLRVDVPVQRKEFRMTLLYVREYVGLESAPESEFTVIDYCY